MSYLLSFSMELFLNVDDFRWGKETNDSPETHVSHNVTNFEFLYEPFYVASDLVPIHDERFMGYGFTRNSQVSWICCVVGIVYIFVAVLYTGFF